MLWTIAVILIILWLLGLVSSYTMGGFIHILLVIAIIVILVNVISGTQSFVAQEVINPASLKTERRSKMKTNTLLAIILIAVGVIAFAYQGITYTTREKVIDLGPLQVTADKTKTLPLPPIVGAIALVGGIVLLVMGNKKG